MSNYPSKKIHLRLRLQWCKCQYKIVGFLSYKNVGNMAYKNVGKPTFLFCIITLPYDKLWMYSSCMKKDEDIEG